MGGRPTILLFDIDGTLLHSGGAGKRAVSLAFAEVVNAADALAHYDFRGATDLALFRAGLLAAGRAFERRLVDALIRAYLRHLRAELEMNQGFRVLPGVRELLRDLQDRGHLALGLGTGNVEQGARLKLARAGLEEHFSFGGFGDDAEERCEVLRRGAERGARWLGVTINQCRVVVIGDSPRDVRASRGIGATCVAVATGGYSVSELAAEGATVAFETLGDSDVLRAILDS